VVVVAAALQQVMRLAAVLAAVWAYSVRVATELADVFPSVAAKARVAEAAVLQLQLQPTLPETA
jgi:hypothetical protein